MIHYRLGDMRKMPTRDPKMGGHGVVDAITFLKILVVENIDIENISVKLVSDEPEIAIKLLKDVGITATSESEKTSIWQDLQTISSAKIFIGSLSHFSFFGATACAFSGGKPYLPSKAYELGNLEEDLDIGLFNYFEYNYLQPSHYLFHSI